MPKVGVEPTRVLPQWILNTLFSSALSRISVRVILKESLSRKAHTVVVGITETRFHAGSRASFFDERFSGLL